MAAVEFSGTLTATPGTEHTLATPTGIKTRVLMVDVAALVGAEIVELRIKGPVLAGGTERVMRMTSFPAGISEPNTPSEPMVMPQGGTITLTQIGGTGRSFPWTIVTLD